MNTDFNTFDELVTVASQYLQNLGRSKESIRIYLWAWNRFRRYMDENKIHDYTEEVAMKYIKATYGQSEISNLTHYHKGSSSTLSLPDSVQRNRRNPYLYQSKTSISNWMCFSSNYR